MYNINLSAATVVMGEEIYFSALDHNALLRTDIRTGKTEYLCSFEKEKRTTCIHVKAFNYKSSIWFIPIYGEYIACYDINRNKIEYFNVPGEIYDRPCMEKYCLNECGERIVPKYSDAGWIDKENIYLVPAGINTAVILNMKTKEILSIPVVNCENEFWGCGTYYEGQIWMAPYDGNQLLSLDIYTHKIQRIGCDLEFETHYGICGYEGKLWFSVLTNEGILFLDLQRKKYGVFSCRDSNLMHCPKTFRDIVNSNGTLWLLPKESEKIIYLDNDKGCFVEYNCKIKQKFGVMERAGSEDDFMYVISSYNYILCLNKDSVGFHIYIPQVDVAKLYSILDNNYGERALYMLMNRYHGGIPERILGIDDYICLSFFYSMAENKQCDVKIRKSMGKIGKACFEIVNGQRW